ncbi:MAG: hypothetical protein MUF76_07395 [Hydrogenophaga sp.]|jgi:hypothetical protein|nr:hypothetical protein [Hydrogenophaga sp.]
MKLHIVPASTGFTWVKLGVQTFFRQPLAMTGLFFMFMATVSVLSVIPLFGTAISLVLVPAATLGLMAATREASHGRFPMPVTLITAFRAGPARARPMLMLGGMYAAALLLVVAAASLLSGTAAPLELPEGTEATPEMAVQAMLGNLGFWFGLALYLPTIMAFWHAPALVHWHGVSPGKSLFFSLMACWGNRSAMLFYLLGWTGVMMVMALFLGVVGVLLGGGQAMGIVVYPAVLFIASMFHTSIFFTFRDSFVTDADPGLPTQS